MDYRDYITIDPNKRGGKPCVRGLRITVHEVLEYLASDMTSQVLRIAAMLALCLIIPGSTLSQSTLFAGERAEIVRAVLKAERERQAREFKGVNQLSTESIAALGPAQLAADFQFTLLTPEEIKEGAKSFFGVHYLAFKDFKVEIGRAVVRVSVVSEGTPCFGPYQKQEKYLTYLLLRKGAEWEVERVYHPRANSAFDPKPNLLMLPAGNGLQFIRKTP